MDDIGLGLGGMTTEQTEKVLQFQVRLTQNKHNQILKAKPYLFIFG